MKKDAPRKKVPQVSQSIDIEAEVAPGLEAVARQEITHRFGNAVRFAPSDVQRSGALRLIYDGKLGKLLTLRTVQAIYLVQRFRVPRPKALLGNEQFASILRLIENARAVNPSERYRTFYIGAAGSDSAVFRRISTQLAASTGLREGDSEGDLWLRFRPDVQREGWEVLVRVGSRPLATRAWRICNYEGALNATVAHAMTLLSRPTAQDRVLNIGSGSASLLIERAHWGPSQALIGVEHDLSAIHCAQRNLEAARKPAAIVQSDMRSLPFGSATFDVILADLPFGQLSGSHATNVKLYPLALQEAARVAAPGARMILITHEVRLIEDVLRGATEWQLEGVRRVTLRGLHPRIYVLTRRT